MYVCMGVLVKVLEKMGVKLKFVDFFDIFFIFVLLVEVIFLCEIVEFNEINFCYVEGEVCISMDEIIFIKDLEVIVVVFVKVYDKEFVVIELDLFIGVYLVDLV